MYNPQLDAFVQVADCGSFNKAAEALYLSSTAVIKQINALEKHLDLQLVFRTNHGITLTEAGKVLYKHAKGIMDYSPGGPPGGGSRRHHLLRGHLHPQPLQALHGPVVPGE